MAIKIKPGSIVATDNFGGSTNFYKANAGDSNQFIFNLYESVYFLTNNQNPIVLQSPTTTKLKFPSYESLNGFAVGMKLVINSTDNSSVTTTINTLIVDIDYLTNIVEFDDISGVASIWNQVWDGVLYTMEIYCETTQNDEQDLYFNLGFTKSNSQNYFDKVASTIEGNFPNIVNPLRNSIIDGTQLRFQSLNIGVAGVGVIGYMDQVGFKSGGFTCRVYVERLSDFNVWTKEYQITVILIQLGALDQQLFNSADSSFGKLYFDVERYSAVGGVEHPTVVAWNFGNSNTAWFNQPFLNQATDSTFTSLTDMFPLLYDDEKTGTIVFDSTSSVIGVGGIYRPIDENYYKNNQFSQSDNCMLIEMTGALAVGIYASLPNPTLGAQWEIEINSLSYVGTTHTVNFTVRNTNSAFVDFMDSRSVNDRNIIIWFKVGNINHMIDFLNMEKSAIIPTEFIDTIDGDYCMFKTDKLTQTYPAQLLSDGAICSIEDNLQMEISALVPKFLTYKSCTIQLMVAEIADLTNSFDLENFFFDLTPFPMINGTLPFSCNIFQGKSDNMPSTALQFQNAYFGRKGAPSDTVGEFGIFIKFPFLINWRYWLPQINAFLTFDEDRNQNYLNYMDLGYQIFVKTTIDATTEIFEHYAPIKHVYDYDEIHTDTNQEWNGTTSIEYFINSTGEQKSALIDGQIMRVKVTVDNINTTINAKIWGQMTIEPFENSPRWVCSTNYAHDNNTNSPFLPLAGQSGLKKTFISAFQQTFEMLIDTTKLPNVLNKISFKYVNFVTDIEQVRSKWNVKKIIETTIAPIQSNLDCCDYTQKVFAETVFTEEQKNDITCFWKLKNDVTDLVGFQIWQNGEFLAVTGGQVFPSQSNAEYARIIWADILNTFGAGCYQLVIETQTAFSTTIETWGFYDLKEYSRDLVEGLVNFRSVFNSNQSIEGIDFTNSNIVDSINVNGYFGERNPGTEVDNVIYNSRINNKVTRENINKYTFTSGAISSVFSKKLYDLHFLSENNIFITDNCFSNHDAFILKNCIFLENSEPEYFENSKYIKIISKFGDKISNSRSFY